MMWWNKIALLRTQLKETQSELEKEQAKSSRLASAIGRLQSFGVSAAGHSPHREFAEALVDTAHALLNAEQVILFQTDADTLELVPIAARGFSPATLARLRLREGESVPHVAAPLLTQTLFSQGRCAGLLVSAKPASGTFRAEHRHLMTLLANQATLILEDHQFYDHLKDAKQHAVNALAHALEAKDHYTHGHSRRTSALVNAMGKEMALPEMLIHQIENGAFLHDIGKIGIADGILKKTGELTSDEYAVMKTHSAIGRHILDAIPALHAAGAIVLYHHEWYNGAGYPEGLAGEEIPLGARLVQILDAWDAMTSNRPYRKAMPKAAAVTELRRQAGSQFDPKLVDIFLRVLERLEREGVPTTEQAGEKTLAPQQA